MFHACVHALIAALSRFRRPLTRLCVIKKDRQKNPVGTTQEAQFNTSFQHAAAPQPASHCPCADSRLGCENGVLQFTRAGVRAAAAHVLGQSGEGWRHHGGWLKGTVNKEPVQSVHLYCQNQALRWKNTVCVHQRRESASPQRRRA